MSSRIKLNPVLKLTVASGLITLLLAGCGIRGDLERPPPLFGDSKVDDDRVPDERLGQEDDFETDDPLDENFIDVDEDGFESDPFDDE